ncbi:hypothetical protein SLEP1_g9310 [Rubroshorea leprosula]|uniref:Uncharacterized protein n=1 Tax=Rubroshorea leprosula TaxID=152421 RepID=A0AAV5IEE7_9ROSI|nr:hypothetical protein SLEP1_g9310 [Rubroshorea leprosula]
MRDRGRERARRWEGGRSWAWRTARSREFFGRKEQGRADQGRVWKDSRRQEPWGYDRGVYNQAIPFFFTNFPDDWSHGDMWRTFLRFGRVFAIYSPQRKNREGRRFGFVRFLEVKDERELERRLNGIQVGNFTLKVNRPKYSLQEKVDAPSARNMASAEQHKSYAEVVKRGQQVKGKLNRIVGEHGGQTWKAKEEVNNQAGLKLKATKDDEEWLKGCMVGTIHSVESVPLLQEKFFMEGYFTYKIRPMGGKLVLLEGSDRDEVKDLVELAADWLGHWFEDIKPWSPEIVATERFTWLKCQGMPVHGWNSDNFSTLGCLFGKFLCLDDSTSKRKRFDVARFLISTPIMEFISRTITVTVNGALYKIKVMEEESTNSLFRMSSNWVSAEKWNSKDLESGWGASDSSAKYEVDSHGDYSRNLDFPEFEKGLQVEDDDVAQIWWEKDERSVNKPKDGSDNGMQGKDVQEIGVSMTVESSQGMQSNDECQEIVPDSLNLVQNQGNTNGDSINISADKELNGIEDTKGIEPIEDNNNGLLECEKIGLVVQEANKDVSGAGLVSKRIAAKPISRDQQKETSMNLIKSKEPSEVNFWEGINSDSGKLAHWMVRGERKKQKKRERRQAKKARLCIEVFKHSRRCSETKGTKRGKRLLSYKDRCSEIAPEFLPASQSRVAGISIADSDIKNRNQSLLGCHRSKEAEKIWEFGKKIGVTVDGNEVEIAQKIEEMEDRDRRAKQALEKQDKKEGRAGDFNFVKEHQECSGSRGNAKEIREFKNFIMDSGLIDLPLIGRKYTWYHSNGTSMSRLDRFLVSEEWLLNWEDVRQWGLKRSISDHCPILLKNQKVDWGPKPFKFFDVWMERLGFEKLIQDSWSSTKIHGWKGYILKEKLKRLKGALKNWSRNYMVEIDKKISTAEDKIAELDRKGERQRLTVGEVQARKEAFAELSKNVRIKNRMWHQKARRMWLREGDANTAFYHKCIKSRLMKNEINCIMVNGCQRVEVDDIREEIAKYFQSLFKNEEWVRPTLGGLNFNQISKSQNQMLTAQFSEEEIKAVIWDCDSSKAPGPDGFNFNFIKKNWEIIKREVIDFIMEFHDKGRIVKGLNESFVVLIPKVSNLEKIEEFRPISLINVSYKILSKLLANRLRRVLEDIIGENQMAFIAGRHLPESVVIANEVLDEARKKNQACFFFKADFEKAFDNVCWSFLDFMMDKLGFNAKWRSWIKECLRSASISVLINGCPSRQFGMTKGLRQVKQGLFEGVKIGNGELKLSHLQFADDTLIMGKATKENIWVVKCIMRCFELVSGLKINYAKSQLMSTNVEKEWTTEMAYLLNCKIGKIPFKYLGTHVGGNSRSISHWKGLVETFEKKLSGWKGRYLSMGGRITLVNSVLSSLPVFQMSTHLLPKGQQNMVNQMGTWSDGHWKWDLKWRRNLREWEEKLESDLLGDISSAQCRQGIEDKWDWKLDNNHGHSTSSAYRLLKASNHGADAEIFMKVWNPLTPRPWAQTQITSPPAHQNPPLCPQAVFSFLIIRRLFPPRVSHACRSKAMNSGEPRKGGYREVFLFTIVRHIFRLQEDREKVHSLCLANVEATDLSISTDLIVLYLEVELDCKTVVFFPGE